MKQTLTKKHLEDYRPIVGDAKIKEINRYARRLKDEHIVMINSTPMGGGVAEILNSLVLLLNDIGVETGWRILKGSNTFFQITKGFHNALQSGDIHLNKRITGTYEQVNYNNALMNHIENHDLVVVHDPQPLALIAYYKKRIPWVWRAHIDLTKPNKELLAYLKPFIEKYDAMIVSTESYKQKQLHVKQFIIHPSIDPLSEKNCHLEKTKIATLLRRQGVKMNKPIVAQVSRFDKWKDPLGVLEVFNQVRKRLNCQLVLIGNMSSDDPEGPEIYREVMKRANHDDDVHILVNIQDNDRTVNALQRAADVVLQKSLREGFALTVSEALWKGTPVVGTRVGGIPLQVLHNKTGILVENNSQAVQGVVRLLKNSRLRKKLGKQGREHVREHFLITRHILDYLKLFDYYLSIQHKFNDGKDYPY